MRESMRSFNCTIAFLFVSNRWGNRILYAIRSMYHIREMERSGVDSASIHNMKFHDERLRKGVSSLYG